MTRRLILASGSPRRRDLLTWCGFDVDRRPQDVDESRDPDHDPVLHAAVLAQSKARSALLRGADGVVVAADTVVHLGDAIFDKPRDRDEARAHLVGLSGRTHSVTTGVCVVAPGAEPEPFTVTTEVRFRTLPPAEIDDYLLTGEADDKAGAYGIQGRGGTFVAALRGSWTNVMGLPVEEVLDALDAVGVRPGPD